MVEIGQELTDWNNVKGGDQDFLTSLINYNVSKGEDGQ
jgi:hypothetical protein